MAIYFCRASHGKVGKAIPHYDYIHGLNKYAYKKNEIAYTTENMPSWAKDSRDFFEMSDNFERANGMSYKELKLALPHEFTLEENKKLLHDFIQKELGDKYYYSAVIHDKEIEDNKVQQNIHVHLMFSTRELDGIERVGKDFFKQAYAKEPEKGGCPKNPRWNSTDYKSLKEIRLSWEQTLNAHLQEHGIEKVSSLSLKEQYQQALKNGDKAKAKLLKRKAINIQMRIYKKALNGKKLTRWEERQYKKFLKNKVVKVSLEKEYRETLKLQKSIENKRVLVNEYQQNIKPINEFIPPRYKSLIDLEKNILTLEKELELLKNASSFSAVKISAMNNINPNYSTLHHELNYYIQKLNGIEESTEVDDLLREEYTRKIATLKNQIESIDLTISPSILNDLIAAKNTEITEKIQRLEKEKEKLINHRDNNIYISPNMEAYILDKISAHNRFSQSLEKLTDLEWELKNINRELSQVEKKLNAKNISETAKDILTKGKYRKNKEDTKKCIDKINTIVREIQGGFYDNRPDLLKTKKEEYQVLKDRLENLKSKQFDFSKSIKILDTIEKSLKEKLESRKEKLFSRRFILEQELEFYKLGLLQDKNLDDIFTNKEELYSQKINNANYYEYKYKTAREIIEERFSQENIKKLAYNKLTKGNYNKIVMEYSEIEKKLEKLNAQKNELNKLSVKAFALRNEISKLKKQKLDLQTRYHNMINAINPKELNKVIKDLEHTKKQAVKNIKVKENQTKNEKFEYIFKKKRIKEYKNEIKPHTFENYISASKELHSMQKTPQNHFRQKEDIGYSRCLFDEEDQRKSLSKFYSEQARDHEDLEIDL